MESEIVVEIGTGPKTATVSLRLDAGLNQRLENEARERGVAKSVLIRGACRRLFGHAADVGERA